MLFEKGQTILFQGDSITDCGRIKEDPADLGQGYAMMVAAQLNASYPELELEFFNRGIGGNCAHDLAGRWQEDCLDLKPDWVSILVGINDAAMRLRSQEPDNAAVYAQNIKEICQKTVASGARLIIIEPFYLLELDKRQPDLGDPVWEILHLRDVAYQFASLYIPMGGIFQAAALKQPYAYWAADSVHPTRAGHALMAKSFIEAIS